MGDVSTSSASLLLLHLLLLLRDSGAMEAVHITGNCSRGATGRRDTLQIFSPSRLSIECDVIESDVYVHGQLPAQFKGETAGRPRDFRMEVAFINRTVGCVPVAVINWKPPASDLVRLRGFLLLLRKVTGPAEDKTHFWRIFDLSRNTFKASDNSMEFREVFSGLGTGPRYLYQAVLYSLPRDRKPQSLYFSLPEVQEREVSPTQTLAEMVTMSEGVSFFHREESPTQTLLEVVTMREQLTAADWSPVITCTSSRNSELPGYKLTVTFTLAPAHFRFQEFDVSLYTMSNLHNPLKACILDTERQTSCNKIPNLAKNNATSGFVVFEDIRPDHYMVEVQAVDPYWQYDDYALCFSVQPSGRRFRKECLRTRLKGIEIGESADDVPLGDDGSGTARHLTSPSSPATSRGQVLPIITKHRKTATNLEECSACQFVIDERGRDCRYKTTRTVQ